jgi:hypothetical protein
MIPQFKYTADETARLWEQKRKELHKAMNGSYMVRLFRVRRWKFYSNEIYRGLVMAFYVWGPLGGLLIAMVIGIAIVQYFKPWL